VSTLREAPGTISDDSHADIERVRGRMRLLRHGARDLGLCLTPEHLAAFQLYYEELVSWNERFNLTAVTEYEAVQSKHFLDSLTCLLALPGRPANSNMKILRPNLHLTLLEATSKKTVFLNHLVGKLGLEGVEIIHGRAEEWGQRRGYRESYDLVVARAVAELSTLVEYCASSRKSQRPGWRLKQPQRKGPLRF